MEVQDADVLRFKGREEVKFGVGSFGDLSFVEPVEDLNKADWSKPCNTNLDLAADHGDLEVFSEFSAESLYTLILSLN